MKGVIRQGDPTSHGGRVVGASSKVDVLGKPVARLGDKVLCPIKGHVGCFIRAVNNPTIRHDGIPVAMEGDRTSCGALLMSTTPTSGTP